MSTRTFRTSGYHQNQSRHLPGQGSPAELAFCQGQPAAAANACWKTARARACQLAALNTGRTHREERQVFLIEVYSDIVLCAVELARLRRLAHRARLSPKIKGDCEAAIPVATLGLACIEGGVLAGLAAAARAQRLCCLGACFYEALAIWAVHVAPCVIQEDVVAEELRLGDRDGTAGENGMHRVRAS
eukprot:scaffold2361_cov250-Pinguiococcus_pyrenoidosus.AAC.1